MRFTECGIEKMIALLSAHEYDLGFLFVPDTKRSALIAYALFRVVWCEMLLPYWHDMAVIYNAYNVSFVISLLILIPAYRHTFRRATHPEPHGATIAAL